MAQVKRYAIEIRGYVQDVGFRNLIETLGRVNNLRGYVYNDVDGTVKAVCEGLQSLVDAFVEDIEQKSKNIGISIEGIATREIKDTIPLPPIFFKAPTDELSDISRKLDIGIEILKDIKQGQDKMLEVLEKIASK
ncbi:MAG: acylphosphatase [Methanobacteriota archaeon]